MPRCCAVQPESKWPITHVRDGAASYPQSSSGAGVDFERISEIELWMNQQALNEWIVYESTVKVSCHNSSPRYMTTSDGSEMMSWKDWTKHLCPITYLKYGSTHSLHFHWMRQYKGHLSYFISINPKGCDVKNYTTICSWGTLRWICGRKPLPLPILLCGPLPFACLRWWSLSLWLLAETVRLKVQKRTGKETSIKHKLHYNGQDTPQAAWCSGCDASPHSSSLHTAFC